MLLIGGGVQAAPTTLDTEEEWKDAVLLRIRKNIHYPSLAARLGIQGRPTLLLKIGRDSMLHTLRVDQSSGSDALDQAALNGVWKTKGFPGFSPDMQKEEATVMMPVSFVLDVRGKTDPTVEEQKAQAAKKLDAQPGTPAALEFRAFLNGLPRPLREHELTSFLDPTTGLKVEVPGPLLARASVRPKGRYDALIDVVSKEGVPPVSGSSSSLCSVGLMGRGKGGSLPQADTAVALENTAHWARTLFSRLGKIERETTFTHAGLNGVEMTIAPRFGLGHAYQRMYAAVQEYPAGRVVISCATHVDAMERALAVFRKVREGVSIQLN
ncbi:energy transducer TonB [Pseudomonas aeruginosa]|uniref:energy transducer TonB n=1 Tax=Pseudomonas aeruginosa TaxID=287 RepID=UPI00070A38BD|nr:TonB family protein [Pseudomonas aeruginosa]NNB82549.1 energy transducer TonB [Pseudomonas aeruginosa]HCD6629178.1 energy transducer TonB [Pseudomonas aeruginosa]HCD7567391.1 energy transducer TonB [Pseudomonas aeruginosa]HCZ9130203.1 energy transducer TonB [Pseudomonas aeruginosa]HDQ4734824.1 energy transducer TonB [Pseudomonas aeruginosa]